MSSTAPTKDRYAWVDFTKGFCIVAVVAMWVSEHHVKGGAADLVSYFVEFCRPFRMPDFFLISGLFLGRVIHRPLRHFLDTKVVHYLYFFVLWTLITVPLAMLVGYEYEPYHDPVHLVKRLIYSLYWPFMNLWFIMMLPVYFAAVRLLEPVPRPVVMIAAIVMMLFPLDTGIYHVDRFGVYFGYLYAGYMFADKFFELADWARANRGLAVAGLAVWAIFNHLMIEAFGTDSLPVTTLLGYVGISALVVASSLLCRLPAVRPLIYLGQNSIVVYLGFFIPMLIMVALLKASPVGQSLTAVSSITIVSVILFSVFFHRVALRLGMNFLYERPQWARIHKPAARRASGAAAADPA